jgi:signal recognition particle GTPase
VFYLFNYLFQDTISNASDDFQAQDITKRNHVHVTDCVKNIVSWVGKGTTAIKDALPSLKEDHHIVMVGLDSAGKTTVLYRLNLLSFEYMLKSQIFTTSVLTSFSHKSYCQYLECA